MFLKFFEIFLNKQGRWLQKFAAGVTKFWPCDEIRRFDGIQLAIISQTQDNKTNIQPDGFGRQSVSTDWSCKSRRGKEIFFLDWMKLQTLF